jgi:hypothetical protein
VKSVRYAPWWIKLIAGLILLAVGLSALALLYGIFGKLNDTNRAAFYLEAAKALFQLVGVLLVGALVTAVIKYLENTKKADKALHDFRLEFLNRLMSLDDSVKKARHVLRSAGLTNQFVQNPVITGQQIATYDEQLSSLQEVESGICRLAQDIANFRNAFSESVILENKLKNLQLFLRGLLDEYEQSRPQLPQVLLTQLPKLSGFTGTSTATPYQTWLSGYTDAVFIVRKDILPLKAVIQA